ncbi:MAG: polyprenyl synthetase family protein [Alphaproteobacteria bacterium]
MVLQNIQANAFKFENLLKEALSQSSIASPLLLDAIQYGSLDGGKRFRPFLVAQIAALFDVDETLALKAAIPIELIHCYSLIHDDLPAMDNDDLRRGRPTVHKKYDEATAILAGDMLQSLAFEYLSQLNLESSKTIRLLQILSHGAQNMVSGQMFDMAAENQDANTLSLKDIKNIQQLKTGALIAASAQFGAILGSASSQDEANIYEWGLELGEAFQITDDLLDTFGNEEKVGKRLQKDDKHGKVTFVTLLGIDGAQARVTNLQKSAYLRMEKYGSKAQIINNLWQWLAQRDH